MKRVWLAFLIGVMATSMVLVAGCGGGGGGSSFDNDNGGDNGGGTVDPPSGNLVLSGKVARRDTGIGVANVRVEFGTPAVVAYSDSQGEFRLNLGPASNYPNTLLALFPGPYHTFLVDTSGAGANYPAGAWVMYWGAQYAPNQISLDENAEATKVLFRQSTNLGTIYVTYDDPSEPPWIPDI